MWVVAREWLHSFWYFWKYDIAEKTEFDKMREKVVELEMENDKLKNEVDSYRSPRHSSRVDLG